MASRKRKAAVDIAAVNGDTPSSSSPQKPTALSDDHVDAAKVENVALLLKGNRFIKIVVRVRASVAMSSTSRLAGSARQRPDNKRNSRRKGSATAAHAAQGDLRQ